MDKINKILNFEIKQVGEESDRVLRFVGSDETPDRDNDILEVGGWKLDEYLKNPVFLWAHNYDEPPVGKAVSVMIDAATKKLLFDVKFATTEEYPFADTIYKLYKGGYLNATSVGFRGVKYETRNDESVINMPEWQRGRRYKEQQLLELSAVPVPSNPNALMQAKSAGIETDEKLFRPEQKEIDVYMTEETKATKLIAKTREFLKGYAVTPTQIIVDGKEADVCVKIGPEDSITLSFDFLEGNKKGRVIAYPYDLLMQKSGATLSKKTKALLDEIHGSITGGGDRLRKFIDTAGIMDEPPDMPVEPMMTAMRTAEITEIKQVLEEIKSQVLFLYQKSEAPKVIDLDAIDAKTLLPTDELNIEPSMLQKLISESVESTVKASVNDTIQNLKTGGINL